MPVRKVIHKTRWYLLTGLLLALFTLALTTASATTFRYVPLKTSRPGSAPLATNTAACGLAWRSASIPLPPGDSELDGVASVSANDVWAVGSYTNNGVSQTLTMHWDGAIWNIIPSVNGLGTNSWLSAVAAYASDDVWAVGAEGTSTASHTFIEHWDGTRWSWVPSPNVSTSGENVLRGVAIAGPNDMWAVGYNSFSFVHRNLTEHWDGSDWSVIPSPNDGIYDNLLHGVTATGPNDVWAVGTHYQNNISFYRTTNIHWNGSTWALYTDPPSYGHNYFFGVFAIAPNDVWAVGGQEDMVAHWDGSSWHNAGPVVLGDLHGVSGTAQNDVWAVGDITASGYYPIYHFDGSFWWNIPSNSGSYLQAVTALSRNDAWAVGFDDNNHALTEHYSDPCATPTPTATGTPPTATSTRTPTSTATSTPPACSNYVIAQETGVPIVPGTQNIGLSCDDCVTSISLPFSYRLYDQTFTSATVSSNGNLQFLSSSSAFNNTCLPAPVFNYAILPYWDDLLVDSPSYGVFTSTTGIAPNRTFNIEWRTNCFSECNLDFELVLYENQTRFDFIYGQMDRHGESATIGVQQGVGGTFTQYSCNTFNTTQSGLRLSFTLEPCATTTPTSTPLTPPPTATPTMTATATLPTTPPPTNTATNTTNRTPTNPPVASYTSTVASQPTSTSTSAPTASATACPIQFTDVPEGSTFYTYIPCLACMGIVNGYADGTFHPNNNVTRGQLSKIISNAAGLNEPETVQRYEDVSLGSTFQIYIGRLTSHGYISGYPCGGPGEPCVPPGNLPYFRPSGNATRGQISKIVSEAAGFQEPPVGQTFEDVLLGGTFYPYIQRLASRSIMSGYPCGGPGEPCVAPANRPYFRPGHIVTRGQTTKIVANTFFSACQSAIHP